MNRLRGTGAPCLLLAAAVAAGTSPLAAVDWPQWRGPGGQGISRETDLPSTWSVTSGIRWKAPIPGRGHSAPIVWGNRIFLTTAVEGERDAGHRAPPHLNGGHPFVHLRTNTVDEPVFATPALANGRVYIRGARHLFAIAR